MALAAAPPPVYTRTATQSCLIQLRNAVAGLPPATTPRQSVLFVYALRRDAIASWNPVATRQPRRHTQLGAWYGENGVILSFFASVAGARASRKTLDGLYGGTRIRNVLVTRDQQQPLTRHERDTVLGCLRAQAPPAAPRTPPRATLRTFTGTWGGHTRGLRISAAGRGRESTDDGCCRRVYELGFRIVSVRGTLTHATATYRVTSFRRFTHDVPQSHVGQMGTLLLRNGIVSNTVTTVYFCSDPAWGATGACGA